MMREIIIPIDVTSGGNSVDKTEAIFGKLFAVDVVEGTLAANFDILLTYENEQGVTKTLLTLTNLSADKTYYPREVMHGNTGSALTASAGGDYTCPLVAGVITCTTADGGTSMSGAVLLYILEDD